MYIAYIQIFILLVLALISDIKTHRIKNSITYIFSLMGLITNTLLFGVQGLLLSFTGWLIPFLLLIALYAAGMLGAGDIKLFSAIGCIAGPIFAVLVILFSFILGGIIAAVILLIRKNTKDRFKGMWSYIKACFLTQSLMGYKNDDQDDRHGRFPFTIAIVPGVLTQLVFTLTKINLL